MIYPPKVDPFTKEEFIPKRNNQRFACRENQVAYNNQVAREKREAQRPVKQVLDENYKILRRLFETDPDKVFSKDFLLGAQYKTGAYTHLAQKGNSKYYCVFDMAITQIEPDKFKIIKL